MTFDDLRTAIIGDLFPWGEAENLITAHTNSLTKALVDLQRAVECYRFGNTDSYPQCSTYFNCGLTVLPQPRGRIDRLYTVGRIKSPGGVQDGTSVGTVTINAPLVNNVSGTLVPVTTSGTVCPITVDGIYTLTVNQSMVNYSLYPYNTTQYFKTQVFYTDENGVNQTVQPAAFIHLNTQSNTGSLVINVKGGTSITFQITSYNIPQVDGSMNATFTVVAGASGADSEDWCSKVQYHQVDYCHIERYVRACRNNCNGTIFQVANALAQILFGCCRRKSRYKHPTDVGYETLAVLPQGFHYAQASTDAGYRSDHGVFAFHRGRIYIAPWVESSESVIIEWDGLKNNWAATDLVQDDPKFIEACKLFVAIDHYTYYEADNERRDDFKKKLYGDPEFPGAIGAIQDLILDCRQMNEVDPCKTVGNKGSSAVGLGQIGSSSVFYNTAQSYTASCPSGQTGNPVTITIAANTVSSSISVADANSQALSQAQTQAQAQLQCSGSGSGGGLFYNTVQTYTASCPAANGNTPAATGTSVTITIPAGSYQSTVSQANANAAAQAAAQAQAQSQVVCTYLNAPQTYTANCPTGTTGSSATVTIAAGQFTSQLSQSDADSQALAAAQTQATAKLSCTGIPVTVGNTQQTFLLSGTTNVPACATPFVYNITGICYANTYTQLATTTTQATAQIFVNTQAQAYAQAKAQAQYNFQLQEFTLRCESNQRAGGSGAGAGGGGGDNGGGGQIPI